MFIEKEKNQLKIMDFLLIVVYLKINRKYHKCMENLI